MSIVRGIGIWLVCSAVGVGIAEAITAIAQPNDGVAFLIGMVCGATGSIGGLHLAFGRA